MKPLPFISHQDRIEEIQAEENLVKKAREFANKKSYNDIIKLIEIIDNFKETKEDLELVNDIKIYTIEKIKEQEVIYVHQKK